MEIFRTGAGTGVLVAIFILPFMQVCTQSLYMYMCCKIETLLALCPDMYLYIYTCIVY